MVIGGSQQETLDPGFMLFDTRQQGVPVILRELMLPDGFDPVSPPTTILSQHSARNVESLRLVVTLQLGR
ncbi:unnamed protein product [Schistosoma margrebowiei]|uniref:Uncharacterized protein n=1 Tax=Schistosoma margrebowiei TaxID=48269 RepID=A0A183N805_9TREM|nr:unnamed protein product [Schistosoma margrebowiei]